jgi:glycine hydroxymethyltransferase
MIDLLSSTTPATVAKTGKPSKANAIIKPEVLANAQKRVKDLNDQFPLYPEIDY